MKPEACWTLPGAHLEVPVHPDRAEPPDLRESEARFRAFVDHATDAFFLHDDRLLVIEVNRQACVSLGYSRDELIGMHPRDFDVGLDEATLARLAERVDAGETVTFESLHRRKDGTVFLVEIRGCQFQQGDRRYRLSVVRDITERKRTEEELRAAQLAIEAERARLAEEINDALAQGLAMIVMQLADAEAKLGPAWARAEKPLGMVRELAVQSLAYARRSVTMLRASAPAAGLARTIGDEVDSVRRNSEATLNYAVTGTAVLLPTAVESALAEIAREALHNAAHHSSGSRVDVELAFEDGGGVRLAVADDGVGFDVRNVRADAAGLTSMQNRAARAGVALTFVTEPGAGTEVVASWSQ